MATVMDLSILLLTTTPILSFLYFFPWVITPFTVSFLAQNRQHASDIPAGLSDQGGISTGETHGDLHAKKVGLLCLDPLGEFRAESSLISEVFMSLLD